MNYDKILVKIEDKNEDKILKDRYKVALYTTDSKEVKLLKMDCFKIMLIFYIYININRKDNPLKKILYLYLSIHISILYLVLSYFLNEIEIKIQMDMYMFDMEKHMKDLNSPFFLFQAHKESLYKILLKILISWIN